MKALGILDRYVIKQWLGTFFLSAVGVPAVAILIDLSERFGKLAGKVPKIPLHDIFLGEAMMFPTKMAMLFPAGALFATVFTLNGMGRHSEFTASKAGGVSFYRLVAPLLLLATLAVPANFWLQELAATSTAMQRTLHNERTSTKSLNASNYVFAAPSGWHWAINDLQATGRITSVLGEGPLDSLHPQRWMVSADSALWFPRTRIWQLYKGTSYVVGNTAADVRTFHFRTMRLKNLTDPPTTMLDEQKKADEMTIGELRAYVAQLTRSGVRRADLKVELALKYAVPWACLVVALFGAPLAVTNPRADAALGLAIALGTTLVYLTGIQILKAFGAKELLSPELAAWGMNGFFLLVAIAVFTRVKT